MKPAYGTEEFPSKQLRAHDEDSVHTKLFH